MEQLQRVRTGNDVNITATLSIKGVAQDWTKIKIIRAYLYSSAQRVPVNSCLVGVNPNDQQSLILKYQGTDPEYLGPNDLILTVRIKGRIITLSAPVVEFVSHSYKADAKNQIINICFTI